MQFPHMSGQELKVLVHPKHSLQRTFLCLISSRLRESIFSRQLTCMQMLVSERKAANVRGEVIKVTLRAKNCTYRARVTIK